MQTHIRDLADGSLLGIDYEFEVPDLTVDSILGSGYKLIRDPVQGQISLIEVWMCPTCKTEQWAIILIENQIVGSIDSIVLNRDSLDSSNFISDHADFLAKSLDSQGGKDTVEILRQHLP